MRHKPQNLRAIIKDLASSSVRADQIVLRLASYSSLAVPIDSVAGLTTEIETLRREITGLRSVVTILQEYSEEVDEDLTDEQEKAFQTSMETIVEKLSWNDMVFGYSKQIMSTYPKNLRYLIALALVNSCTLRDLPGEDFWQDLVSKQGVM